MLRYCIKHTLSYNSPVLRESFNNLKVNKVKYISIWSSALQRPFATKVENEEKLERIYYGPLTPQIRAVKVFSLCSSLAGLVAQPILIKEASTIGSTSLLVAVCSVVGFFTFITPILLHVITKKYVTEIEYDDATSTYKASTVNFFLVRKEIDFKPEDVEVPDVPGMFTTMNAKGKPLFIEARHFTDPMHYAKIMGYDKPMDFKMGDIDDSNNKNK
ncbi:transmembrane protein 70 homolog, mitochondrial [Galleria mellonella]|uniref:Transmembrane protein 70 homolog, mitochondrial n=1 Tax=Galleria mellonella TaxID=7137 RepID=A0A6J1WLC1_GALME|nr:transmembrane protein 70 homolog, mitochondrial [Galleria mellonella]